MAERGSIYPRGGGPGDPSGIRGGLGRTPVGPREDVEQERDLRQIRESHPFMRTVAQMALVVGGTYMLGRMLPRDGLREALDVLGQVGRDGLTTVKRGVGNVVRGAVGPFPEYHGLERAFMGANEPTYRNLELIGVLDDIMATRSGHQTIQGFARGLRSSRAGGPVGSSFDQIMQEQLANKFLRSHPGHAALRHVTVGDVMASADLRRKIGQRQFQVMSEAVTEGLITERHALTSSTGDVVGLFRDGTGRIIDTRWASPGNLAKGAYNVASRIQIMGFRPANLFASLVQPFRQGEFFGEIGAGTVVGRGRRITSRDGISFVVNKQLYTQTGYDAFQQITGPNGFKVFKVGEGQSTHTMDAFKALMGEHQLQRRVLSFLDPSDKQAHPIKQFWGRVQETAGFGPGYKSRPHVLEDFIVDPLKRMEAIRKGGAYVPFREGALPGIRGDGFGYVNRRHIRRTLFDQVMAQQAGIADHEGVLVRQGTDARTLKGTIGDWMGKKFFGIEDPDELAAMFGREHRGVVLDAAGRAEFEATGAIRGAQRAVDHPIGRGGFGSRYRRPNEPWEASMGRLTGRTTVRTYVTHDGILNSASLLANQMTIRLNDLLSGLMGYGIRPAEGHLGAAVNLARIYGGYKAIDYGVDYLGYADYLSEKYTGISPKKLALQGYVAARTGLQKVREFTGLQAGAEWMEDTFPGIVDSPLSQGLRFGLPITATMFNRSRNVSALGAAAGFLFGFGDIKQDSSELYDEMTGEKDVAYRRGRWWMMGRQPFSGGQIEYFGKSWIARQLSDYQYTDSQYGSKSAYWQRVAATPTPSNLFGLLADPVGYMSHKHYYTRPYPFDADGEPSRMAEMIMDTPDVERDVIPGAAGRLGMPEHGNIVVPRNNGPYGPGGKVGMLADKISELGGIYKFALWDFPGFSKQNSPQIATPDAMSSEGREYYDNQFGGMLGMTEAYRRFLPDDKWSRAHNTIPNLQPSWLPGMRSEFPRDKSYYMDFTLGDPYTKVKHGEARLPGPGYEVLHRLHSGTAGVYDAMDRFLILGDIAPYSEAFKHYKAIVQSWAKAGVLDDYWQGKFDMQVEQVKDKLKKYDFSPRRFTGLIDADEEEQRRVAEWNFLRRGMASAWEVGTHDVVSRLRDTVPLVGPILGDKLAPIRSPIEMYKKWEVYGEDFADWRKPWKSFVRPKIHELAAQDPITAAGGGAMLGMFGADPLSKLILSTVGAAAFGVASGARVAATGQITGGYIPGHREEERTAKEYLDNLKYTKYRRLQMMAEAAGDRQLANQYKSFASRTVTGLNYELPLEQFRSAARSALGKRERAYFDAFSQVTNPSAQEEILQVIPERLRPLYMAAWSKMGDPLHRRETKVAQMDADERSAAYWAQNNMPGGSWAGWHPSVSQSDIAIRLARQEAMDMHRFNLWESQEVDSRTRFPDLAVPVNLSNLRPVPNLYAAARDTGTYKAMQFSNRPWSDGFQADGVTWEVIPERVGAAIRQAGDLMMGG